MKTLTIRNKVSGKVMPDVSEEKFAEIRSRSRSWEIVGKTKAKQEKKSKGKDNEEQKGSDEEQ